MADMPAAPRHRTPYRTAAGAPPRAAATVRDRLRLVPPDAQRLPAPLSGAASAEQRAALEALAAGMDVLVHGAPGSGRTRLALTAALEHPGSVLLAPRRSSAGLLRDAIALSGAVGGSRASTPAGLAFAVVREAAARAGRGEPTLVTGADQDALLRDLIAATDDWEVPLDPATRRLPGFRDELRDIVSRAVELGLLPRDLRELSVRRDRPAWRDAARILRGYLDVLDLEASAALDAGPRYDSGRMVREAARLVARGEGPSVPLVVVDDAQDLTAAGVELVRALRTSGAQVLLTSCPDAAVDTFRGALPDAALRILPTPGDGGAPLGAGGRPVRHLLLGPSQRTPHGALSVIEALRGRLPLAGAPTDSRRPADSGRSADPGRSADSRRAAAGDGPAAADVRSAPVADVRPAPAAGEAAAAEARSPVAVLRAPGTIEEARWIATVLRDLHHAEGVAYDDMAVVCRSGGAVDDLVDLLQRQGLPVTASRRPRPLRDEQVVADLLTIIELAVDGTPPGPEQAAELLQGPFGDADALRLRRIRRLLLRAHERKAAGDGAPEPGGAPQGEDDGAPEPGGAPVASAELLARALVAEDVPGLPEPGERDRAAVPVHRIRRMIAAVRALGPAPGATDALWAAWEAARLAEGWREASLETDDLDGAGARGRLAARRLDAVTALFAAAERFTDRRPQADALVFIEHVRGLAIAEDTLAPGAQLDGRVRVLTPAAVAGEDADTVVLAHMQEGAWPNLRLRSTLFGAAELALSAADPSLPLEAGALRAVQREAVMADEIRLAVSALSRARARILVTAVDGEDLAPSAFVDVIERAAGPHPWVHPDAASADPGPAPDPRRLVAALRRRLLDPGTSPQSQAECAHLLALLADAGAPGADPGTWYHRRPSSTAALLPADAPVRLSPSALERAHACPQAWLLERSGGSGAPTPLQSIGTAVHRIAQDHPAGPSERDDDGRPVDLLAQLTAMLAPLHLERAWSTRRMLARAENAVELLARHLEVTGQPLAVEAPFTVSLGDVELHGTMDRVEGDATGLRVVDLKTGAAAKSKADAALDLQLAAYQAAIRDGALAEQLGEDAPERLTGAQLVYVGTGARTPVVRTQGALTSAEDPRWFDDLVAGVARELRGAQVTARPNAHCDRCAVRRACALQAEGEQL